jgi:hypothetical protein
MWQRGIAHCDNFALADHILLMYIIHYTVENIINERGIFPIAKQLTKLTRVGLGTCR